VGDRLPDQLAGVGVGLQQPHDVTGDLAGVVAFDAPPQAGEQLRAELPGSGRLIVTCTAPSSATVTGWVRTDSSPWTQVPSDTRNFQLCQAHR
jgi:hypothetical protein